MFHGRRVFIPPPSASFPFSTQQTPNSALGDLLLAASLSNTISCSSDPAALDPSSLPSPLSDSAVLHLLRLPSLPPATKLGFFRWAASSLPSFSPSPAVFSALFRSILRSPRPPLLDHLRPLLRLALSSPAGAAALDPPIFRSILDALLRSGHFDSAIAALDDAEELAGPALLTPQTYGSIIRALLQKSQLDLALSMFRKILMDISVVPDVLASNELLVALRRTDMRDEFRWVFDELSERSFLFDTWSYNICIHAFGSWGQLDLALRLFKEMKSKAPQVVPDLCTYN